MADEPRGRAHALTALRITLAGFVLAWIFGPHALRAYIPVWLPFVVALGLELHFFVGTLRARPAARPDAGPQTVDRERYGYADEPDELLLVQDGGDELWLPYSGESAEEVEQLVVEARERPADAPRPAPPGHPLRRLLIGVALIAALAATLWVVESRTGWDSLDADARAAATARFSAEAARVAGKPVTIRCDESGERVGAVQHTDGVAVVGGTLAYLAPERCLDLYRLAYEGEIRPSRTARALAVLAHEAWHLRGTRNEATTECYALQSAVGIGRRLGLSEHRARQLMRQQLVENSLRARGSPEYVVRADCRNGGRLDLHPNEPEFP